jgi:hypothetical protein
MSIFQDNAWLTAIIFSFVAFGVVAIILRRRASKMKSLCCTKKASIQSGKSSHLKSNAKTLD